MLLAFEIIFQKYYYHKVNLHLHKIKIPLVHFLQLLDIINELHKAASTITKPTSSQSELKIKP